jgi:hypothetical protein
MKTSVRLDRLREIDQVKEDPGTSRADTAPQGLSYTEETQGVNLEGLCVPDEGTFETFVGGAGI